MQAADRTFQSLNSGKANFDAIYALSDPREYFRVLCGLDYVIPDLARNIFRVLIARRAAALGRRVRVLDAGCSYGINAALVRFPLDIQRLAARYADPRMHALPSDKIVALDGHYFRSWPEEVDADFIGLDSSEPAVSYASQVGLIAGGVTTDLERIAPVPAEVEHLRGIDLIASTGCVGYVSEKTFQRVLSLQRRGEIPWVANFVLRMFPYDTIARALEGFGLVTEKLEGVTFVQRRFHSEEEFESTLAALKARGIDHKGKEAEGLYHAELFVSRPAEEARRLPLSGLVSVTSGESRRYGRRYRRIAPRQVKLMR